MRSKDNISGSWIQCPFCENGLAPHTILHSTIKYKGRVVEYDQNSYVCRICKEGFTTNELDDINISNVKSSYRNMTINKITGTQS